MIDQVQGQRGFHKFDIQLRHEKSSKKIERLIALKR